MAGSNKWFLYTADNGTNYALYMDESNGEAVSNIDLTDANFVSHAVPRNISPRYSMYVNEEARISRKIYHSTIALYNDAPATIAAVDYRDGSTITLTRKGPRGERLRFPTAADTGQLDGDDT